VKKTPERGLTGKYVKNAGVFFDPVSNEPKVHITFNPKERNCLPTSRAKTSALPRHLLDGELRMAPTSMSRSWAHCRS